LILIECICSARLAVAFSSVVVFARGWLVVAFGISIYQRSLLERAFGMSYLRWRRWRSPIVWEWRLVASGGTRNYVHDEMC